MGDFRTLGAKVIDEWLGDARPYLRTKQILGPTRMADSCLAVRHRAIRWRDSGCVIQVGIGLLRCRKIDLVDELFSPVRPRSNAAHTLR
jgi:hypothetical protein